ncbi:MAG: hypothetical protein J6W14_08555, partial [Clostridia bacterium]|nr:hypothetical protein [Clostridia bacterium]
MKIPKLLFILLGALVLASCGKDDLHYLETTAATTENTPTPETFPYTPSDNREPFGNPKNISTPLQYHDGYLYFVIGNGMDTPMKLVRYNCESGNATAVCPDPLCDHGDADCPLFHLRRNNMFVVGEDGNVYFDALTWNDTQPNYSVLQFDAKAARPKRWWILATPTGGA